MFLMWFDDDRKKGVTEKIMEAIAAYEERFHARANLVLVNALDVVEAPQMVKLRPEPFIQRSTFYVGIEDLQ